MTTKMPLCRYCMTKRARKEWANAFCSKDHAAQFILSRMWDWYWWNEEIQQWEPSGTDSNTFDEDDDDTA